MFRTDFRCCITARTLHEMKGRFTKGELSFLAEAFKGAKLSPQLAGQELKYYCEDAMMFRKLREKWQIKSDVILKKFKILHPFKSPVLGFEQKSSGLVNGKRGTKG